MNTIKKLLRRLVDWWNNGPCWECGGRGDYYDDLGGYWHSCHCCGGSGKKGGR